MKDKYQIVPIDRSQYFEWIMKRHYAKTIPSVSFAFGLFDIKDSNNLVGVCTFGTPCRNLNDGYACFGSEYPMKTWELNRLIAEEGLPKNSLSYFVSQSLKQIKTPCCIVSYADENNGHHGYIYQATNWIYAGKSKPERKFINTITNKSVHPRTMYSKYGCSGSSNLPEHIKYLVEKKSKHRYFMFLGNKREIKEMRKHFKYEILDYPKGENQKYEINHKIESQMILF